jgi:drug/metabolite transporter (DMT)-like permease
MRPDRWIVPDPERPLWKKTLTRAPADIRPRVPHSLAIWAALIAVYIVWGSTYLAIRFAVESLPPFSMAGVRFVLAGAALYAWRRARGDAAPPGREWRAAAIIGVLLLVGGNGGVVWAEQRVASGVVALLAATVPLWMVLIDTVRPGGRRPGWRVVVGVALGFPGAAVLIQPTSSSSSSVGHAGDVDLVGAAVVMVGMFLWSIGSLYGRSAPLPSSPLLATGMEMLAGGTGLLLLGGLAGEWGRVNPAAFSARSLWAWAYLIVCGSWVGFTAYTWLLRAAPTPLVSTYAYVNPLVAILLGHLLAGESLTARVLIAAAVIVGSVAWITAIRPGSGDSKAARPEFAPAEEN